MSGEWTSEEDAEADTLNPSRLGYLRSLTEPFLKQPVQVFPLELPWRTGRKVGRTIYAQLGKSPSDDDPLIGLMDTPALAASAVETHNASLER